MNTTRSDSRITMQKPVCLASFPAVCIDIENVPRGKKMAKVFPFFLSVLEMEQIKFRSTSNHSRIRELALTDPFHCPASLRVYIFLIDSNPSLHPYCGSVGLLGMSPVRYSLVILARNLCSRRVFFFFFFSSSLPIPSPFSRWC